MPSAISTCLTSNCYITEATANMNSFAFGLLIFWGFFLKNKCAALAWKFLRVHYVPYLHVSVHVCGNFPLMPVRSCLVALRANESAQRRGPQSERTVATNAKWLHHQQRLHTSHTLLLTEPGWCWRKIRQVESGEQTQREHTHFSSVQERHVCFFKK